MTQLAASVDANDELWTLDALPASSYVQIEDELVEIRARFPEHVYLPTETLVPAKVRVNRAVAGTTAASHANGTALTAVYGVGTGGGGGGGPLITRVTKALTAVDPNQDKNLTWFSAGTTYDREDWENGDDLFIPGPGVATISARVDCSTNAPFVIGTTNLFIEILADSFDISAGNVVGRNAVDGDNFAIFDEGPGFATVTTTAVRENPASPPTSEGGSVVIHVTHDAGDVMDLTVKVLVVWFPA